MLGVVSKAHHKYPHVYAIVRFDLWARQSDVTQHATVVKVLSSRDLADQEASRLNDVNKGKDCVYDVQVTRFIGTIPQS